MRIIELSLCKRRTQCQPASTWDMEHVTLTLVESFPQVKYSSQDGPLCPLASLSFDAHVDLKVTRE